MTLELRRAQARGQELLQWRRALRLAGDDSSEDWARCVRLLGRNVWLRDQIAALLAQELEAANDP